MQRVLVLILVNPGIEIDVGHGSRVLLAVTFSADGEYLLTGGKDLRVWRVKDGKEMAKLELEATYVWCLAVSQDGRWITAGGWAGVSVWDAKTFEKVLSNEDGLTRGVDFSPDSTRLVSASSNGSKGTASIWDTATRKRVQKLDHGDQWVWAAKYSPEGDHDRLATTTEDSVRVWDGNDGHLLKHINLAKVGRSPDALRWFNNHLLVVSERKFKRFEVSTGSESVSEWPVPCPNYAPYTALSKHGGFIATESEHTVTFWDTATHTQLGLIQFKHPQDTSSIALSPDDRFLAIAGKDGKITINSLYRIAVSILSRCTSAYQ